MCALLLSRDRLFMTTWTVAHQAALSMGFFRQEYWSGLPCPPPRDLPDPGFEPASFSLLHWLAGSLPLAPPGKPLKIACLIEFTRSLAKESIHKNHLYVYYIYIHIYKLQITIFKNTIFYSKSST